MIEKLHSVSLLILTMSVVYAAIFGIRNMRLNRKYLDTDGPLLATLVCSRNLANSARIIPPPSDHASPADFCHPRLFLSCVVE